MLKRLLGLLVNSSGQAHAKNAKKIANITREQDRRLAVSILAASTAHSPEAERTLRDAWMYQARKPSALARELLRNFPKRGKGRGRRRGGRQQDPDRRKPQDQAAPPAANGTGPDKGADDDAGSATKDGAPRSRTRSRRRSGSKRGMDPDRTAGEQSENGSVSDAAAEVDLASVEDVPRAVDPGDDQTSRAVDPGTDTDAT